LHAVGALRKLIDLMAQFFHLPGEATDALLDLVDARHQRIEIHRLLRRSGFDGRGRLGAAVPQCRAIAAAAESLRLRSRESRSRRCTAPANRRCSAPAPQRSPALHNMAAANSTARFAYAQTQSCVP
jgi:hypothetical protein